MSVGTVAQTSHGSLCTEIIAELMQNMGKIQHLTVYSSTSTNISEYSCYHLFKNSNDYFSCLSNTFTKKYSKFQIKNSFCISVMIIHLTNSRFLQIVLISKLSMSFQFLDNNFILMMVQCGSPRQW